MKNVMPDTFWAEAHNSLIHQLSLSIHLIWLFTTNHYLNCEMVVGRGVVLCRAPSVPQPVFTITEKAPTRAFSWLKAPTSAFTFKTLLRHYIC